MLIKSIFNFFRLFLIWHLILIPLFGTSQSLLPQQDTAKSRYQEPQIPADSLGRRTPRGTVQGFIKAVAEENYGRAALFLSIDKTLRKKQEKTKLVKALQELMDKKGNIYPYSLLSNDPQGFLDDNLGPNLERIGTAKLNNESFDLILESKKDAAGAPVWVFSSQTIQRVPPDIDEALLTPLIDKISPDALAAKKWMGVPVSHWLATLFILITAYLAAWGLTKFVLYLLPLLWKKARTEPHAGIISAFSVPIQIYGAVWIFVIGCREAGISIILRQRFSTLTIVVLLISFILLLWQLVNVITRFFEHRMSRIGNQEAVSALLFLRRAAKTALIILCVIMILSTLGFDVTTGLAALGIGGIALALGAQKTVENFVGSVTLIADRPVRVGDFCKVGDITGTVQQIGMRSTQIRTNDRTVVTIPNGEFSSLKIENFTHRDRFLFHPIFGLRFETSPEQIRSLLGELRNALTSNPKVDPNPARVRFIEIGVDSLNIEIFAYINAANFDEFLEVQEELYLRMITIIKDSGTDFAFRSQTIYLAEDSWVAEQSKETKSQIDIRDRS
jgi:MscS family membrane protein